MRYTMTDEQLAEIREASRPVPVMKIAGRIPCSQQEKANAAWQRLAEKMGFDYTTVRPVRDEPENVFNAEPL